jgi:hypothetical protein
MGSRFVGLDSACRPESYPILNLLGCQYTSSHSSPPLFLLAVRSPALNAAQILTVFLSSFVSDGWNAGDWLLQSLLLSAFYRMRFARPTLLLLDFPPGLPVNAEMFDPHRSNINNLLGDWQLRSSPQSGIPLTVPSAGRLSLKSSPELRELLVAYL